MDSYDTFRFLRYTQIYGEKIFKRSDVINWLDYNIEHRKVIDY